MKRLTLVLSMMIALIGLNANAAMYIVGNAPFGDWNPSAGVEMTNNNGVYTYKATISGSVWFVFATDLNSDWGIFNGQYRIGPTSGNETVVAGTEYATQLAGGDNGAYKFTGTGEEYTITFDQTNMKFKIDGYVEPITENTYTVAGSLAALFGTTWDENNDDNDMTLVNGLYTWTKQNVELPAGAFEFKVVANNDWGNAYPASNYVQAIEKHGMYNVTITFNAETKEVNCVPTLIEEIIDEEDPIYTVTGSSAELFGDTWDAALLLEANEMTKGNDGIYTWTKQNVALTAGTIEFKVVLGHAWGVEYPENNWVATIEQNGNYDVTITFNPETKDITFTATPVVVTEDFYTVAGAPEAIFGAEWNPAFAANNMTLAEGLYTWTKEDVEIAAGTFIEFKVVKNANWSTCWPADNYEYTVEEAGTYDLVITYNAETDEVTFAANKQGGEEPEMVYTVAGPEAVFGSNWDATDEDNDMVLDAETGLYTWTKEGVELTAGFGFKVVGNHDWANEWPQGYDNNWNVNIEEAGIYTLVITFNAENGEINCVATKTGDIAPVHYDGDVYIMGEVNDNGGWFTNVGVKMTRDSENNLYTATITTAGENIDENDGIGYSYFSFTKQLVEAADDWDGIAPYRFGAVSDGDFWVVDEVLGQTISLQNNGQSFRVPAGTWNLTVSVDNMTLVIEKVGYEVGDVNHDNTVDVGDVTALIGYVLGNGQIYTDAANIDGVEEIDVADVTALITKVLGN